MRTTTAFSFFAACAFILGGCSDKQAQEPASPPKTPATTTGADASKAAPGKLSALKSEDVKVGTGGKFPNSDRPADDGDLVVVKYTGKLANGTVFDSNEVKDSDGKPKKLFGFTIGEGSVIKGWDQGVKGMRIGGERKLSIPAELGYGAKDMGAIPSNSDLFFDIKLVDIIKKGENNFLDFKDVKKGTGAEVKKGSKVTVTYSLSEPDGNLLDDQTSKPFTFTVGDGKVYPAIDTGIQGMREGGERLLHIPPGQQIPGMNLGPTVIEVADIHLKSVQ